MPTAYTSVDEVAARFPNFARSGAAASITSLTRSANVVTATTAAAHGFTSGWTAVIVGTTPAGATAFDGTFPGITVVTSTTFTYQQIAADDTATGGAANAAPKNKIGDGQIQNWIWQTADFIEAVALSRGYDLTAPTADAANILKNLNLLAAQIRLGEAMQANSGSSANWGNLDGVRTEYQALLKSFQRGDFDKNFLGDQAKTQDAGPQLGGYVPGAAAEPDNKYSLTPPRGAGVFRKGQRL